MKLRLFNLVLFLAVYLPLEEFILKWLPVSDHAFLLMRQMPDVLVFSLAFVIFLRRTIRLQMPLRIGGGIEFWLAVFVLVTAISGIVNRADPLVFLAQTKGFLRYIVLMYAIVAMEPSESDIRRFIECLTVGVGLQVLLGAIQWAGGMRVRDLLAARSTVEDIAGFRADYTGTRFEGANNLIGTMGNTINYALFLIVGLAAWLAGRTRDSLRYWAICFVFLSAIYLTGARSPVIAAIVLIACHQALLHGRRRTIAIFLIVTILVGLALVAGLQSSDTTGTPDQYASRARFFSMFSHDYINEAMNQRLGMAVFVLPRFFSGWRTFIGYSPDKNIFVAHAAQATGIPEIITSQLPLMIEDVYWFALLFYYGVIGLTAFIFFLAAFFRNQRRALAGSVGTLHRQIATWALLLLIASVPLNLFNQAFTIRQFSFYLWVCIGLSVSLTQAAHRSSLPELPADTDVL